MKESSKPLALASTDYQSDDIVEAIVFLQDLSHDAVMETFADRYPEECALYVFVKECDEPLTSEDIDSDMLDAAISHKRQIYREAYAEWNQLFVEKFSGAIDIVFTSFYSPMVLVRAPYHFINDIERDDMVTEVAICPPTEYSNESLAIANTMTRADYVRDTCGNRGSNVKIGLVEYMGKPDVTDSYLTNAAITICPTPISGVTTLSHSTIIARILVGTSATTASDGFAPDAQLFCSSFTGNNDLYNAIEWLISSDVCVFWLRQNSISGQTSQHPSSTPSVATVSNLDLQVIAPNNTTVSTSATVHGNFEIVQFTPTTSGTYTIKIIDQGGHTGKDYIGIALWQGTTGQ